MKLWIDLQKSDKFNRGYFLHTKFVMWEHELVETSKLFHFVTCDV